MGLILLPMTAHCMEYGSPKLGISVNLYISARRIRKLMMIRDMWAMGYKGDDEQAPLRLS